MKKYIIAIMAAAFAGCSNHGMVADEADVKKTEPVQTEAHHAAEAERQETAALIDRARWGDGQAYLQLADRYRLGIGTNKDYFGMLYMALLASEHGSIKDDKEYVAGLEDGESKTFLELMHSSRDERKEKKDSMLTVLNAMESADAMAFAGIVNITCGDFIAGKELVDKSAERGSTMAKIAKMFNLADDKDKPDVDSMLLLAKETPFFYAVLVEEYRNKSDEESKRIAAYCCKEAEKHALLRVMDARWLLEYYRGGGDVELTDEDVKRLEAFVRSDSDDKDAVVTDSVAGGDVAE